VAEETYTHNALIKSTQLGIMRGHFTFFLHMEFEGSGQGYGGIPLDIFSTKQSHRVGLGFGIDLLRGILKTVGVRYWEDLPNTYCRVVRTNSAILSIGHIVENKWFDHKHLSGYNDG